MLFVVVIVTMLFPGKKETNSIFLHITLTYSKMWLWFLASNTVKVMLYLIECCFFTLQNEMCTILHHDINVDQVQENW